MFGVTGTLYKTQFYEIPFPYYIANNLYMDDWKNNLFEYQQRKFYKTTLAPSSVLTYNDFFKTYQIVFYRNTTDDQFSSFVNAAYPTINEYYMDYRPNIFNCEETGVASFIPWSFSSNVYQLGEIWYDSLTGGWVYSNHGPGHEYNDLKLLSFWNYYNFEDADNDISYVYKNANYRK
jgi:hypothetical protein